MTAMLTDFLARLHRASRRRIIGTTPDFRTKTKFSGDKRVN
jgi:hypothetical protein